MAPETFVHTPPEWAKDAWTGKFQVKELSRYAKEQAWTPPKGHESWCVMQQPPRWRARSLGDTPMASATCTCPKNATAKRLQTVAARTRWATDGIGRGNA